MKMKLIHGAATVSEYCSEENYNVAELNKFGGSLRFVKNGKNRYGVIKQGVVIGFTAGQSRYWYLRHFNLLGHC